MAKRTSTLWKVRSNVNVCQIRVDLFSGALARRKNFIPSTFHRSQFSFEDEFVVELPVWQESVTFSYENEEERVHLRHSCIGFSPRLLSPPVRLIVSSDGCTLRKFYQFCPYFLFSSQKEVILAPGLIKEYHAKWNLNHLLSFLTNFFLPESDHLC